MKSLVLAIALALAGCGGETANPAATKAAEAKPAQAKESFDRAKKDLEKASQLEQQRADPLKEGY